MPEADRKAIIVGEQFLESGEKVFFAFDGTATFAANEMMMVAFVGVVINELVADLALVNATGFLQEFEGTVNG